jgi:UDP-N-acetyl-2-amino-2-deoxyglucuronate dehydrogenase
VQLREKILASTTAIHDVDLTYITSRGPWYDVSWKGDSDKSGGVPTNIGIHFFDMLIWLFGNVESSSIFISEDRRIGGFMQLQRARVRWFLSIEREDLPFTPEAGKKTTFRSIVVDGAEVEFSEGFGDLHTRIYEETLAGRGFGLAEARPSIELVHRLRSSKVTAAGADCHPMVRKHLPS